MIKIKKMEIMEIFEWCYLQVGYRLLCLGTSSFNGNTDAIITKVGKNIFGCEAIFDHAAKSNQSKYPWAQNIVSVGLLKQVKGRWACLFLDFRFYLPLKTIQAKKETATIRGDVVPFQTKMAQAAQMLIAIAEHFSTAPILTVTDSWFGNNADVDLRGSFKNRSGTSAQSEGASQFRIFRYPPHHCRSGFGSGF
ncbi:transposase [Bathymodiolus japonicus methanotrophic gill symbiont]|uniref:transposase n=1 Tax=Bathymodiolus japonicus methanotrophic gill symbiont TaxID=113269 RepID=UPI001C8EC447|nr:transposase [Bathymodiolus japonicus methanotrophic gill symbiont]